MNKNLDEAERWLTQAEADLHDLQVGLDFPHNE